MYYALEDLAKDLKHNITGLNERQLSMDHSTTMTAAQMICYGLLRIAEAIEKCKQG
jgi:hypothetical protein